MKNLTLAVVGLLVAGTMFSQKPVITSFLPESASTGTPVILTGSGFNATAASNIVYFGATKAQVITASTTSVTVIVPAGATYKPISLWNAASSLTGYSSKAFIPTFLGVIFSVAPQVTYQTGGRPVDILINDPNQDGKPDLTTADLYSTLSLHPNPANGSTNFSITNTINTLTSPSAMASGDIDGDGKPDLAVADMGNFTISIYLNNGSTLLFSTTISTIDDPSGVALADMDGDGKLDLVVLDQWDNAAAINHNISTPGNPAFEAAQLLGIISAPQTVSLEDLNADGKPDLIIASDNQLLVYKNTSSSGSISFVYNTALTGNSFTSGIAIGDLDADGKPDIVTGDLGGYFISVLLNTTTGSNITFGGKLDYFAGVGVKAVALGDLSGDGKLDIVSANSAANTISIFTNTTTLGVFALSASQNLGTGDSPSSIAIGDLDADGKPEIIVSNMYDDNISIFHNTSSIITLGVHLLTVTATKKENSVELNWVTSSETNSNHFDVERSGDGQTFTKINTVNAAGQSTSNVYYSIMDNQTLDGKNFYRLKQVDRDGKYEYSAIVAVTMNDQNKVHITLSPQPMLQVMTVTLSGGENNSSFRLYDLNGNTVGTYSLNSNSSLLINRDNLSAGMYFYKLLSPKGEILDKGKVVVK